MFGFRFVLICILSALLPFRDSAAQSVADATPTVIFSSKTPRSSTFEADLAASIPWPKTKYLIIAQDRPVADVIVELGEQHGIRTFVSDGVKGRISGRFDSVPPGEMLTQICRSYNLLWMFYNGFLYIGAPSDVRNDFITLRYASADRVIGVLDSIGIISPSGLIRAIEGSPVLVVTGLSKFVEITRSIAETLDRQDQFRQQGESVIEVFPLNHAWAYDVDIGSGGETSTTPTRVQGVATLLQRLVGSFQQNSSGVGETFRVGGRPGVMTGALGPEQIREQARLGFYPGPQPGSGSSGGAGGGANSQGAAPPSSGLPLGNGDGGNGMLPGAFSAIQPQITSDVRRNAVVIRDTRENMAFYASAIAKLDVPVRVVEISAAIVDLRIGGSRSLGLNTVAVGVDGYGGVAGSATGAPGVAIGQNGIGLGTTDSEGNTYNSAATTSQIGENAASPANVVASGVFGTTQITAAINALEQANKAKTLSRPTVLTLDNFGATISRQETFYVNSTGQYVSNLFDVSTGLSLQVVPHVTIENNQERIYLQVRIEDGTLGAQQVSSIPTVQQSTLTTQAIVKRDQSLMVGGLYIKLNKQQVSGYPWLQRIPVLGYLFSVRDRANDMVERLFVITPRIVQLDSKKLGDYSQYFKPSPTQQQAIDLQSSREFAPVAKASVQGGKPMKRKFLFFNTPDIQIDPGAPPLEGGIEGLPLNNQERD